MRDQSRNQWRNSFINIVTPKEAELIARFDQAVYHIEQPASTLHATGKIIITEHVHKQGYKMHFFASNTTYSFYTKILLGRPDRLSLGLNLSSPSELASILQTIEGMNPQNHVVYR